MFDVNEWYTPEEGGGGVDGDDEDNTDDPSGILNPGKTFIQGFLSLINFLKARDKHPAIIFNIFAVILLLVTILKPSMVEGTSL